MRRTCGWRGPAATCLGVCLAVLGGCQTSAKTQGDGRTTAAYNFGSLEADLPDRVRVPAALSAAEAVLRRRGYAVKSGAWTEDDGEVRGVPAPQSDAGSVRVRAWIVPYGTRVGISVGMLGDESLSRAIMDEILQRLRM